MTKTALKMHCNLVSIMVPPEISLKGSFRKGDEKHLSQKLRVMLYFQGCWLGSQLVLLRLLEIFDNIYRDCFLFWRSLKNLFLIKV